MGRRKKKKIHSFSTGPQRPNSEFEAPTRQAVFILFRQKDNKSVRNRQDKENLTLETLGGKEC